jgi:hypothetical protein
MAHPVYKDFGGVTLPSVTTVLGMVKEQGLINWMVSCAKQGKDFEAVSRFGMDVGTITHDRIDCFLSKRPWLGIPAGANDEIIKAVETSSFAWWDWWDKLKSQLEIVQTEMSMVSEVHHFGGTTDAVVRYPDPANPGQYLYGIGDWKTSNQLQMSYKVQVAAYKLLVAEQHPEYKWGSSFVLRLDKKVRKFETQTYADSELEVPTEYFLHLLQAYKLKQRLERSN